MAVSEDGGQQVLVPSSHLEDGAACGTGRPLTPVRDGEVLVCGLAAWHLLDA